MVWACEKKEHEVEGPRPRGRPKRTWREVVERTIKHINGTRRMLWITVNGES